MRKLGPRAGATLAAASAGGRLADRSAIVIGGGISGVLCTGALARAGFRVTNLEARHLGAGSSSRTAAGIRQQFGTDATVRAMRYCVRWYRGFSDETDGNALPIIQNGYLFLFDTPEGERIAEQRVAVQRAAGLSEIELLRRTALRSRFPWVGEHITAGTFCPTDGFLLPHLVYMDGAAAAKRLGATFVQGAAVIGASRRNGLLTEVHTTRGNFAADVFVDCTNAWTRRTAALLGAEVLPVDPLKRYLWMLGRGTSLSAADFGQMPLVITPLGAYCRPENADTLLLGKLNPAEPEPNFTYEDQDRIDPAMAHNTGVDAWPWSAWAELAEALPPMAELGGLLATTSGYYATTPDHNPFYGFDRQLPNLVRAVGYSGHGAMLGPFTAATVTALCEAGHDLDAVKLDGETVSLASFRIGREPNHPEAMVI